ncbi:MAG: hypothetical protein AB7V14_08085 [Kiritimatiellia bacterium]
MDRISGGEIFTTESTEYTEKNREEGLEEIARRDLLQPVGGFPPVGREGWRRVGRNVNGVFAPEARLGGGEWLVVHGCWFVVGPSTINLLWIGHQPSTISHPPIWPSTINHQPPTNLAINHQPATINQSGHQPPTINHEPIRGREETDPLHIAENTGLQDGPLLALVVCEAESGCGNTGA